MRLVRPRGGAERQAIRARAVVGTLIAGLLALLGWAWFDGGREPVREIVQPVPVPETAR